MRKYIISLLILMSGILAYGQTSDQLVSNCIASAGADAKYLKDFRIQLGKATETEDGLRYKANMSLWKSTKYRFTMCNSSDSKGQLILSIKDDANKVILSSFNKETGKTYPFIDFVCNKSGIYQLNFDFTEGQQGSGVGVVSMVK
ncbi:MAG TPA: hypothetical protein PLR88_10130 [Bacteroidales bacterium]|nr:hypothetical protein [Bacteroidales bacterium]